MNMFKRNRKEKEYVLGAVPHNQTSFSKASRGLTRRKKKQVIEEEPKLDLSLALPEVNELRTSLLMPNLSARFSMLREQDDPSTKVGKASDDSVLFPKRASRLNIFSNSQLMDIAEVESIRSAFKPPFAENRQSAVSDGYASDDGGYSIMSRSRPGEGNNLFGGRQKMYMIASGSTRDSPYGMVGAKHTYEDDIAPSAFQKYRREQQEIRDAYMYTQRGSLPSTDIEDTDGPRSPSTSFSQNRGTQSSTTSGPSNRRTSTAATSVVPDSPLYRDGSNAAVTKAKDQDTNSSLESVRSSTSPNFRRINGNPHRPAFASYGSQSATNLRGNYARRSPTPASRTNTPGMGNISPALDFGLDTANTQPAQSPSDARTVSPPATFDFGINDMLANHTQPNDRGKATAMGLFNKPAQPYDDKQYEERQVRMHGGRSTPSDSESPAASRASPELQVQTRSSITSSHTALSLTPQEDSLLQISPKPDRPSSPALAHCTSTSATGRRSLSNSRARSKSSTSLKEANVKARVELLIRKQNDELAAMEAQHVNNTRSHVEVAPPMLFDDARKNQTSPFWNALDNTSQHHPSAHSTVEEPRPSLSDVHPALRDEMAGFNFGIAANESINSPRTSQYSVASRAALSNDRHPLPEYELATDGEVEKVPLSNTHGLGLSGLVRTHLRQDSDKSSMYPPPSPAFPPTSISESRISYATASRPDDRVMSNTSDSEHDRLKVEPPPLPEKPPTPTTAMSQRAQQLLGLATAIRDANTAALSKQSLALDQKSHQRNESTETQKEMRRFDEELARRREKIDEKLQSVQERSRSRSPNASPDVGFNVPKPRLPVRSNVEGPQNTKAMKIFNLARDQPSPRPLDGWQEHDRPRMTPSRQGSRPPTAQEYDRNGRLTPGQGRSYSRNDSREYDGLQPRFATRSAASSSRAGHRERSNSAADRSQSRARTYGADLNAPAMPGGFPVSPHPQVSPDAEFNHHSESPDFSSGYERATPGAAGQYMERNNYFNSKPFAFADSNVMVRPPPRPSLTPSSDPALSTVSTPMSPRSYGPASPTSASSMNGRTTPTATGRTTPSGNRKRSVTKHMISEPTFLSSTSSVPLVHLPRDGGPTPESTFAPPIPNMNPRRRGTGGETSLSPRLVGSILPTIESPTAMEFGVDVNVLQSQSRSRNRLRKSSSEGGNMAARARAQALIAELEKEKSLVSMGPMFPNRSATNLGGQTGQMF